MSDGPEGFIGALSLTPQERRDLMAWYAQMGVDEAVEEAPPDRTTSEAEAVAARTSKAAAPAADAPLPLPAGSARAPSPPPAREAAREAARPARAPSAAAQEAGAREAARACATLEELEAAFREHGARALPALAAGATHFVFSDGQAGAKVMLVGEAPGAEEDRVGRPFMGRSGQLLDKMLGAIGLARADVYIANVVPWRPPGNRTPTPQEVAACLPFVARQVELVAPRALVTLGGPASQALLAQKDGVLKLRGRWFEPAFGALTVPALATLHPAYLLRQPAQKRLAWRDVLSLKERLAGS